MTQKITGSSVLDIYIHYYELALRATLCYLTCLFTIQMSLFIRFIVNTKYDYQISIFDYKIENILI
jgi:hypothetical protein